MILRLILGALLVAMALGQLVSFGSMTAILDAYGVTSGTASTALAVVLIAGELVAGLWLLVLPGSKALAPAWVYLGVAALWALLAGQAYARGLTVDNCGCFGTYLAQPLRWFVLVEDALMLLYGWLLLRASRRPKRKPPPRLRAPEGVHE
ncbi:MauE/DoxX family redox-associated membrane protein [Streptomyces alboflavus]|uniref:MauE/DoxX family redox-associated membrane protein n=1 Tax=Streptomyces alboflavus TaxID=67267 RepID=UPI00068E5D88|nr:MauE/DoxX family redox-associated membrane protein [Streptomyces alboflavus]